MEKLGGACKKKFDPWEAHKRCVTSLQEDTQFKEIHIPRHTLTKPAEERTPTDVANIVVWALRAHPHFFGKLEEDAVIDLCCNLSYYVLKTGEFLFREGDSAHEFYLILMGELGVVKDTVIIDHLQKGITFGEVSLKLACTNVMVGTPVIIPYITIDRVDGQENVRKS